MKKSIIITLFLAFFTITNAQNLQEVVKTAKNTKEYVEKQDFTSKVATFTDSVTSSVKQGAVAAKNGVVSTTNFVDTSGLFKTMYSDLKTGVKALAETFKTTAEQVLYIMGKKYFLDGIFNLIGFVALVIISIFLYKKVSQFKPEDETMWAPVGSGILIIVMLLGWGMYNTLYYGIQYTFNPEYYVLQDLIEIVKTFK